MATKFLKSFSIATGISTTLLIASFSSHALAMSHFRQIIQFTYNNKGMGSATRALSQQGNNWTYQFTAKAGGIASASETSKFSFANGKIGSQSFSRTSKILIHNNTMSINFNPGNKTISTKKTIKRAHSLGRQVYLMS